MAAAMLGIIGAVTLLLQLVAFISDLMDNA